MKTGSYKIADMTIEPPDFDNEIEIWIDTGTSVFVGMYDLQKWVNKVIEEKENEE